jgi:hypothetical protein
MNEELCSICGKPIVGRGHNAQPVEEGRCCDDCQLNVVLPTRATLSALEEEPKE